MKICWDKIDNLIYTKSGKFRTGHNQNSFRYYEEKDCCKNCGEAYLMPTKRPSEFCSKACCQSGAFHYSHGWSMSEEQRAAIGRASKKRNQGPNHPSWKGGVTSLNLPRYDTYANKISFCEATRRDPNNLELLQVKCFKCEEWYTPTTKSVINRVSALNNCGRECHLYCSNTCKNSCPIYNKVTKPAPTSDRFSQNDLYVWRKEVLRRASGKCEYCDRDATIAHHIQPKKLEPWLALDPENGIACCRKCHYKYGHTDKCSTGSLSSIVCI